MATRLTTPHSATPHGATEQPSTTPQQKNPVPTQRTGADELAARRGGAVTGPAPSDVPTDLHEVMNQVIHHGLRRDLRRVQEVLRRPTSLRRRVAMIEHLRWMLEQLHHHHEAEDEIIWPVVLRHHPDLESLSEQMEAEHDRLSWAIERLHATLDTWSSSGDAEDRAAVRRAAHDLTVVLEPHLQHEETVAMPALSARLTDAQWAEIDKKLHRLGSPSQMARQIFWMLDDLDDKRTEVLRSVFPKAITSVLTALFGRRERRRAELLWD
ncbi:hypothetical protein GIS00_13745 [Nakamurella sp. YIM 132087]|uniref:Hemerythrin-like domain-containing protein n=1 Tax=Nakamurella alba TaxID=2665158 RepID=A0A7K1FLI1_9ACTN|nr:hemerythrin domain-containing protein [Nakamurella alba]MTD15002.1 hypothetical protein [Nakamurella alba]